MLSVSVVLPTRNNEDHIRDLLSSIFSQSFEGDIEVLVMDSSDDDTPQIVKELSHKYDVRITHVEPEDYNYGATRNLGASMTSGDFLVFISTDVEIPDQSWMRNLLKSFEDPTVAGVYGRQIAKEDALPMEEFFMKYTYPSERQEYFLKSGGKLMNLFFSNTNSAIKRKVWEKIPLPVMLRSEDHEWAKRAIFAGYKVVYDPEAVVYHSHNNNLKQIFKVFFDTGATLPYVYGHDDRIKMDSFLFRGLRYIYKEIQYFISRGYVRVIPYALIYNFMKFFGYTLGKRYKSMPIWMRKAFSNKSNHWYKYDDVILNS